MAEERRDAERQMIEVPAQTAWPMIAALGVTLGFAGLVTNATVSVAGIVLSIAGAAGWFREVLPVAHREAIAIEPEPEVAPERVAVAHLQVGELGHRARLPLEIYPYSAGIRGGLAGGAVMAFLAVLHGIALHGSPWYTANLLAASALPGLARNVATLSAFSAQALLAALLIHAIVSTLVGLLYGVLLPMLPERPMLFGGVAAPALWSGLMWASLRVLDPTLDARIEWRWFVASQVIFGLTAGWVVSRSERISTLQHLPFALRAGVEASGIPTGEPR